MERTRVSFDGRPELGKFLNGVTEVILIQVQMSILEMIFFLSFIVHYHDSSINFNIGDYHRDSFSREGVSLGHPRLFFFNLGGEEGGYFFLALIFLFVPHPILAPAENFLMALQLE